MPTISTPCTRCKLYRTAKTVCVPPRGSSNPVILFVGEGPGKAEDIEGSPFVGWAGKKLDELIRISGIDPSLCGWTNIVRCVPWLERNSKVRPPDGDEIDACCEHLEPELLRATPVFIVPLGASAATYFLQKTGSSVSIGSVRGKRYVVSIPTVRYRYMRMIKHMAHKGVQDEQLFQTTPQGREKAIARAVRQYGFKDMRTRHATVFPTWHPASIKYGNATAEYEILADLNFLAQRISGEDRFGDYTLVTSVEEAVAYFKRLRDEYQEGRFPYLSYDVETTSLNAFDLNEKLITLGFAHVPGEASVIPWDHHESPFKGDLLQQSILRDEINKTFEMIPVVGQNLKYDYKFSAARGIWIREIYDDTELQGWTLTNDTTPHDLDYLTTRYTDFNLPKQEMKQAQDSLPKDIRYNMDNYELDLVYRYNGADCDSVLRLLPVLTEELKREKLYDAHRFYTLGALMPTIDMEMNGVPIDRDELDKMHDELTAHMNDSYDVLERYGVIELMGRIINDEDTLPHKRKKFNLASPEMVSVLLFDALEFTPVKYGKPRKAGKLKGQRVPSADKHVLQELMETASEHVAKLQGNPESGEYQLWVARLEIVKAIQQYKSNEQLYKMYVKNMPARIAEDGFVRCNYGIRHTDSGRFNCVDPSLHTIPWHSTIKRMFVSRFENGVILSADHAQMELRVFAMATGDEQLIQTFKDGKDIHRMIASRVLRCFESDVPDDERRRIKTVVFGLLYGRGPKSIAAQEGMTVERAKDLIESVFRQFPRVRDFIRRRHAEVRERGFVRYINGFRRIIHVGTEQDQIAKAERQAVNTVIQGPASDLAVVGMINMRNAMRKVKFHSRHWEFKHDDLAYDIAPGELMAMMRVIQREMVDRPSRTLPYIGAVPLKVDFEVGVNWGGLCSAKKVADNKVVVDGEEEHIVALMERLMSWEDSPTIVSYDSEVKQKTAVVRSLMKSTGAKVDYNHITTELEFPDLAIREPRFVYKPMVAAAS